MTTVLSRKMLPLLLLGLGGILLISSAYFIWQDVSARSDFSTVPATVSYSAPELTLTDTQGISRSLVDYRGQVVLVNLWATWCEPCKREMPALQSFYNRYRDQGFVVIGINDGDAKADVLEFVREYRLTFPVWLDPTYIATEQAFKTLGLPSSFVIDRGGTIRLQWVGGISRKMLDQHVIPLITEQP
ncbi:MAG TPA: TlpA disulfide reductase family protein [Anaerolineales bacterium]|nr:TlpA disulfide reductase family protein [Anaerolineales bacterium]